MMESELEYRLRTSSKEQLTQLLQELALHHPVIYGEITAFLDNAQRQHSLHSPHHPSESLSTQSDVDEDVPEDDWDFGGDEPVMMHTFHRPLQLPVDGEVSKRASGDFVTLLSQQDTPQVLADTLTDLLDEAESRTEQDDYPGALDLYALLIDERLLERTPAITPILDEAIDAATPALEDLLVEASSNAMFDATAIALSPLLTSTIRHQWLERLFQLWLKRLDAHRVEEDLPDIILNVAWSEDISLLRTLTQNELQKHPRNEHSNIVNFTQQYRTKALEKFLKELPKT
ncbi:MAG: hypothetical protein ACYDER_19265 [Ktedonobacteraceae bacterium]